jgi:Uma2 family endonuclease
VKRYLNDGVKMVWVVDPQRREIAIHKPGSNQYTVLSGDAVLTAEDILPGFALKLSELFT